MKKETNRAAREAAGCFLMLVLGAMVCVGFMRIAALAASDRVRTGEAEWWQNIAIWLFIPAALGALIAWLTYGLKRGRNREKPG